MSKLLVQTMAFPLAKTPRYLGLPIRRMEVLMTILTTSVADACGFEPVLYVDVSNLEAATDSGLTTLYSDVRLLHNWRATGLFNEINHQVFWAAGKQFAMSSMLNRGETSFVHVDFDATVTAEGLRSCVGPHNAVCFCEPPSNWVGYTTNLGEYCKHLSFVVQDSLLSELVPNVGIFSSGQPDLTQKCVNESIRFMVSYSKMLAKFNPALSIPSEMVFADQRIPAFMLGSTNLQPLTTLDEKGVPVPSTAFKHLWRHKASLEAFEPVVCGYLASEILKLGSSKSRRALKRLGFSTKLDTLPEIPIPIS